MTHALTCGSLWKQCNPRAKSRGFRHIQGRNPVITLGIILLIISIFIARQILLPLGVILIAAGLIFWALNASTYAYY